MQVPCPQTSKKFLKLWRYRRMFQELVSALPITLLILFLWLEGKLAPCFVPPANLDYDGDHKYIDEMLPSESPVLYGLQSNAEMGFLTTSDDLFKTPLEMQPMYTWERDHASLQWKRWSSSSSLLSVLLMTGGIHILLCYFSSRLNFRWRHQIRKDQMTVNGCNNAPAWPRGSALGSHLDQFLFHIEFNAGWETRYGSISLFFGMLS